MSSRDLTLDLSSHIVLVSIEIILSRLKQFLLKFKKKWCWWWTTKLLDELARQIHQNNDTNSKKSNNLFIPRWSRRDIVLVSSVRPHFLSVQNHISVPMGQIWFILGTNDKYHELSISYKFGQNLPLNTWVIALV